MIPAHHIGVFVPGVGELVASSPGLPFWPGASGMGEVVPTAPMYPIPQNSVLAYSSGGMQYSGPLTGMGALSDDLSAIATAITGGNWSGAWSSFMTALCEPVIGSVRVWMIGGSVILLWALFFSDGKHSRYQRSRRASAAAKAAYA